MGFSVSGSAAIIFLAVFVSIGMLYTAGYNSFERVKAASDANSDALLEQQNTDIAIRTVTNTTDSVTIAVENTGSTTLRVDRTDVLLDGTYQTSYSTAVDGNPNSALWAPGETLRINASYSPNDTVRIKIVSGPGVAAFREVTV